MNRHFRHPCLAMLIIVVNIPVAVIGIIAYWVWFSLQGGWCLGELFKDWLEGER